MRRLCIVLLAIPGCALDWSRSEPGDAGSGGASGGLGGTASGGAAAGSGGAPSGGSGGAPGGGSGGAGGVPCTTDECVGLECGAAHPCGDVTQPCCVDAKNCAQPGSVTTPKQYCVPTGCWDGALLHCDSACGDHCGLYGLICCKDSICKPSCT